MKGEGGDWIDCKPNVPLLLKKSNKSKLKDIVLSPIPFEIKPVEEGSRGTLSSSSWRMSWFVAFKGGEVMVGCRDLQGLWGSHMVTFECIRLLLQMHF